MPLAGICKPVVLPNEKSMEHLTTMPWPEPSTYHLRAPERHISMPRPLPGGCFQYGHSAFVPILNTQLITTHEVEQLLSNVFKVGRWLSEKSSPLQMVCQNTIVSCSSKKNIPKMDFVRKRYFSIYIYVRKWDVPYQSQAPTKVIKVCFLFSWQAYSVFKQRHGQVLRLQKVITKPGFHGKKFTNSVPSSHHLHR